MTTTFLAVTNRRIKRSTIGLKQYIKSNIILNTISIVYLTCMNEALTKTTDKVF